MSVARTHFVRLGGGQSDSVVFNEFWGRSRAFHIFKVWYLVDRWGKVEEKIVT